MAHNPATRKLRSGRTRRPSSVRGDAGLLVDTCAPPPDLSRKETVFWNYYVGLLAAERRLTKKVRDGLAKYCTSLAIVAELRVELAAKTRTAVARRAETRKELRQWLLVGRLLENDLLLNPASSARAPVPVEPEFDSFSEFDLPPDTAPMPQSARTRTQTVEPSVAGDDRWLNEPNRKPN